MNNEGKLDDDGHVSERRAQSEDAGRSLPAPRRRGLASAAIHIVRGRWSLATNVIVAASRAAHMVDEDQRAFRRETQDALEQVLRGEVHVALVVDQPQDLAAINYCQQGDSSLYSDEALRRRAANRTDPGLLEAVRDWWSWLPKAQTSVVTVVATAATPLPPLATPAVDEAPALPPSSPLPCIGGEVDVDTGGESFAGRCRSDQETAVATADVAAVATDTDTEAAAVSVTPGHDAEVLAEAALRVSEGTGEGGIANGPGSRRELAVAEDVQQDRSCLNRAGGRDGGVVVVISGGVGVGVSGGGEALASASSSEGAMQLAAAQASVESISGVGGGGGGGADSGGSGNSVDWASLQVAVLDEPIYAAMVVVVTWVLLPRFGIRADPEYDPSQDWLEDNEGLPYMDFKHFFDAMFDLADVWSIGVEASQYVDLLVTLLQDVQQLETTQAAFSRLLHKFRAVKHPPTQQQQQQQEQPPQPVPPHPFHLQQQPVQQQQQPSRNMRGHSSETKKGDSHQDLKPDPRLPPPSTVAVGAAPVQAGAPGAAALTPAQAEAAGAAAAVAPRPLQRGLAHRTHSPGPHAAMLVATMTVATPVTVAFPARITAAAASTAPPLLPASHRAATSRATSPAPSSEVAYGRRDATFKLPQYNRLDVSGIRSPLADYLRSGVPRPDQAKLEEWRRRRTGSSSRAVRCDGHERSSSAQRIRTPSAVALSAELLRWPHSPGSRDGSDGPVLMYEEYMHDMAARYLAQQQKVLVATSAGAAAAAGQLLAAAAAASASASARAAWEDGKETSEAAPMVAPEPARPNSGAQGLNETTVAAAPPPAATKTHQHQHQHREQHHKQQYQHQPNKQKHLQQQQQQQQEQRQQLIEEEQQQPQQQPEQPQQQPEQPQQQPEQPQQLSAPAAAAWDQPVPGIRCQNHEGFLDPELELPSATDADTPLAASAFTTTEAVNAAAAAVATDTGAVQATAGAVQEGAAAQSPAPPRTIVISSTSPRGPVAASTHWSQPPPLMPPPLPPLTAPTIDPQLIASPQPVCVVGHAVTVEPPPPPSLAFGLGAGGGSPGAGGARASRIPFRRQSRTYSSHAAAAHASTSSAPVNDPPAENAGAWTVKGPVAAMAVSSAPQSASGAAEQDATGGYTDAEAQAKLVVTFAAAAYRLADPNVHSLLLPTRLTQLPRDGSLVVHSLSLSSNSGGLSPGRVFSGRSGGSSPPYSPSSQRARTPTAPPSTATVNNVIQPYLSTALSCMVPHFASEMSGGTRPGGARPAGEGTDGGGGGPATAWSQSPTSPVGERPGLPPPAVAVSPPGTPLLAGSRRPSTALPASAPTSVSVIAAAAAAAAAAANSLGGAVTRRLASAALSRAAPPHQAAPTTSRPIAHQPPGAALGNETVTTHGPHGPHQHQHQHVPDSMEFYPTYHYHVQNLHQQQHQKQVAPSQQLHQGQNQEGPTAPHSPGGASGTGSGGSPLMSRWGLTPQSWSTGLVQTPRSTVRPGAAAAATSAQGAQRGGSAAAAATASGGGRRFSAATGLHGSSGGGSASGGVGLPTAGTTSKLRSSYSSPMMLAVALSDTATAGTAASNSRRGSRSSGYGDEPAAAAVAAEAAATAGPGRTISSSMAGEGVPSSSDAAHGGGFQIFPSAALQAARRRSHTQEYAAYPSNAAASVATAGQGSDSAHAVRSPVRIRSSDPVGFADAVTATRMNVAIMADELLQRQAEQRAQAKRLRERTLHLRPSTAAARQSFPNAFGAFLAAREATGMAWGSGLGATGGGMGGQGGVQRPEEAQPPLA